MTTPSDPKLVARRALAVLDLTDLSDSASDAATERLASRAATPHGNVAALCIYPRFVKVAKLALRGSPVRVATVANFPHGNGDTSAIERQVDRSLEDGAEEIDLVMSYRALLRGQRRFTQTQIERVRRRMREGALLKVILETGELKTPEAIAEASRIALAAGAGMLKTSTGKVAINATPQAAEIMLAEIKTGGGSQGFKAAGGIRTLETAATYLSIADRIMGAGWAQPSTFRLGASGLLDELTQVLNA
jgi:deoxyribose-phosphate aldolase